MSEKAMRLSEDLGCAGVCVFHLLNQCTDFHEMQLDIIPQMTTPNSNFRFPTISNSNMADEKLIYVRIILRASGYRRQWI
jgi:hypothetical protein